MAFKPNYGLQRADRNRAAQAQSEQKQRKRDEQSAQRKAERASELVAHLAIRRHNEERGVTAAESKGLKKGSRVYWRGDAADGGSVAEMTWDAATIVWDNGELATVHHGDMREIQRRPVKPATV